MITLRIAIAASLMAVFAQNGRADYATVVSGDSPAVWFRMNESSGTTAADSSGGGVIAYHYNGVTPGVPGLSGLSAFYDGIDDRSQAFSSLFIPGTFTTNTGFTVELWMKASPHGATMTFLQWYDGPRNDGSAFYQMIADPLGYPEIRVRDDSGNYQNVIGPTSVTDNQWHYLVMTFGHDSTNTPFRSLYVDGELASSNTNAALSSLSQSGSTPVPLDMGTDLHWVSQGTDYYEGFFDGSLDEIAVYSYALTSERIAAHYDAGVPEPATLSLLALGGLALVRRRKHGMGR